MLQDATGRYAFSFLRAKGGVSSREKSATLMDERKRYQVPVKN
jgi:hypothetical protein